MRHERLTVRETEPAALRHWPQLRNPLRVTLHIVVLSLARYLPLRLKNAVYRALGMAVGEGAAIGLCAMFDIFHPEKISIGADTTIGYGTVVLAHETTADELRVGPVDIGDGVMIGANCTVLPGVTIGDGATVGAGAVVTDDVAPGAFVTGIPAQPRDR